MKVVTKKKIGAAMWVLQCPLCGKQRYSASEAEFLPDFFYCDCDINGNRRNQAFELFEIDGKMMIRRNKYPRFIGEVTFDELTDVDNIEMIDECVDSAKLAKAIQKAGEFLLKINKNGNKR